MERCIITNISMLNQRITEPSVYESDWDGISVSGVQTNDAPVKVLLHLIARDAPQMPARIFAVTTEEAKPAFARFQSVMGKFAAEMQFPAPAIEKIDADEDHFAAAVQEIVSKIPQDAHVYIDTTGGFRSSSYLLTAVVRILEYAGIRCRCAVYSKFHDNPKRVIDVTDNYRLFELINAANSFTAFGNSTELAAFFRERKTPEIQSVVGAMKDFSDAVAMCRTSNLDSILKNLNESLLAMESAPAVNEDEILFRSISGKIRSKFGIDRDRREIGYPEIIRWCLDNQMIQQAVTIYTEKIPEYLLKEKYYEVSEDEKARVEDKEKQDYEDLSYALLYKGLMHVQAEFVTAGTPIAKYLKQFENDQEFKNAMRYSHRPQELIRQYPKSREGITPDVENALRAVFTLMDALFDRRENRIEDAAGPVYPPGGKRNLFPIAENHKAKRRLSFVNELMKLTADEYVLLQGSGKSSRLIYADAHLNNIVYLEDALKEHPEYTVQDIPQMQLILRDYYYIKSFLRNSFNHASDEQERTEENVQYFQQNGYPAEQNAALEAVIGTVEAALDHLNRQT